MDGVRKRNQTWVLHERNELVVLVDASLDGQFDAEEACRFLKIGLLCTQDSPKIRPSMSNVMKMLTGEVTLDDKTITKPGIISDFMELKVKDEHKEKPYQSNHTSYTMPSSIGS
ncbi:Cold-responsive protein kinase [Thalictrum thalictroides]|uniref:Cold-responsive protein kinase n=1 Tax=Thalictrum thalictroides TaxID=46969 RepID=A0A7J6W8Y2_THATH|nr:Cold-responsive protein kinase [Thalictrum thalictroides]